MRRWIITWGIVSAAIGAPGMASAQNHADIVLNRELASAIPQLRRKISLELKGASIDAALRVVAERADLPITYNDAILPIDRKVWLTADDIRTDQALEAILKDSGLRLLALKTGQVVVVKGKGGAGEEWQRDSVATVQGRVVAGETGTPIAGATITIVLRDTVLRAITGDSGTFAIANVPWGQRTVVARYIGYRPVTRKVMVDNAVVHLHLALEPQAVALDELVTTATGQQRRRDLGNAITTIKADSVLRSAPIRNLTDLLANRVPGMSLQHTSGAPGDPARIRLRGLSSVMRGNDPVVVVDGIRVYAAQSEARSGNLTNLAPRVGAADQRIGGGDVPAPSPLNQIDPNTIEKIEVLKGPSAATLYGADAANGVIVITTKRGKPGPTRWSTNVAYGRTTPAGAYPTGYFRWGHMPETGWMQICVLTDLQCQADSLVRYQALNDPKMTILGQGQRAALSLTASGGSQALTYSVTGSYADETGLLKLPEFEVERFRTKFNREPFDWMRRPHHLKEWGVSSNVSALLGHTADVTLSTRLQRTEQQRASLESQQGMLAGLYVSKATGWYYTPSYNLVSDPGQRYTMIITVPPQTPLSEYYRRTTASTITFTTGMNVNWRPRSWFTATGRAGLDVVPRDDEMFLPSGLLSSTDSGALVLGSGRSLNSTLDLQGTLRKPLRWGFVFETSVGANIVTTTTNDLVSSAMALVPGTSSLSGGSQFDATDSRVSTSVFGWHIEPRITGQRLSLSAGLRLDGGSAYGARVTSTGGGLGGLLGLPKLNGSWVVSEEPWFPFQSLFNSLRLRGAYGQAQVQPSATDRLRLYTRRVDGTSQLLDLDRLGNAELRPERSTEFEGGFDADVLNSRVSVELTGYRKVQIDALMPVNLPSSVNGGGTVIRNIGNIKNTGIEVSTRVTPVQTPLVTWSAELNYNRNANVLTKLGAGVEPNPQQGIVAGYPVASRWSRPILGFADQNMDGIIDATEVQLGDSLVFMGRLLPAYQTSIFTNLSLFRGAIGVTAGFSYDAGATQINETLRGNNWVLVRALSDPETPPSQQAAVAVNDRTDYGVTQTVSTFRFNSLSVNYRAPTRITRLLHAQNLSFALQGSNLGMHSTYQGKDPDVTAWSPTERIVDTGQLALPRTWQLRVDVGF